MRNTIMLCLTVFFAVTPMTACQSSSKQSNNPAVDHRQDQASRQAQREDRRRTRQPLDAQAGQGQGVIDQPRP
jgi:hypothetical protein